MVIWGSSFFLLIEIPSLLKCPRSPSAEKRFPQQTDHSQFVESTNIERPFPQECHASLLLFHSSTLPSRLPCPLAPTRQKLPLRSFGFSSRQNCRCTTLEKQRDLLDGALSGLESGERHRRASSAVESGGSTDSGLRDRLLLIEAESRSLPVFVAPVHQFLHG